MCLPHSVKISRGTMTTQRFSDKCPQGLSQEHPKTTAQRNNKKRVTMQSFVSVHPIDQLSSQMTRDEKSCLYYSAEDLNGFNLEVKAIRETSTSSTPSSSKPFITAQQCLNVHSTLRGLELHVCTERVRNKHIANRAVMKYQNQFASTPSMTSHQRALCLAGVSAKISKWSSLVALETARLDTLDAYGEDDKFLMRNVNIMIPVEITPFPAFKRRVTVDSSDDEDRCKPRNKRIKCC